MGLSQAVGDDAFHQPDDDSPWHTETAWYSFWTPGGEYAAHVYLRFRVNLGIANSCIYVWGPGTSTPWEAAYWKHLHVPMPKSLTAMELLGGLRHEQRVPFESYDLSYVDNRNYGSPVGFDVRVNAVGAPEFFGGKHFDQAVRVTGQLDVDGRSFAIDCLAMRDRSWYRRGDFTLFRSAYSYALAEPGDGFLALYAAPRDRDMLVDDLPLVGGHRLGQGPVVRFVDGQRVVRSREPGTGRPVEISVRAVGADGVPVEVHGRVTNCIGLAANPNMFSWMSLVEWSYGGRVVLGEDQEIWSPSLWRAFRQSGDSSTSVASIR